MSGGLTAFLFAENTTRTVNCFNTKSEIYLRPIPEEGWVFDHWEGTVPVVDEMFTLPGPAELQGTFRPYNCPACPVCVECDSCCPTCPDCDCAPCPDCHCPEIPDCICPDCPAGDPCPEIPPCPDCKCPKQKDSEGACFIGVLP